MKSLQFLGGLSILFMLVGISVVAERQGLVTGETTHPDYEPNAGFCDYFLSPSLNPGWTWVDPLGDSSYSLTTNPGRLRLYTPDGGHDLYAPANFDAPRLVQPISGNFIVTTKVTINPTYNYQGAGLLIWQEQNNFIRLERTLVKGIDMLYRIGGVHDGIEIPYSNPSVYLRLQRLGNNFTASYSDDGFNWTEVSTVNVSAANTLLVGLDLINQWQDNPIWADFDFFELTSCDLPDSVALFFSPPLAKMPPETTISLMIDSNTRPIGFAQIELDFDQSKVNLANEIKITGDLSPINVTPRNEANESGRIAMGLALETDNIDSGPSGVYELAQFQFNAITSEPDESARLSISDQALQIFDLNSVQLSTTVTPAFFILNPTVPGLCGPPAADACADMGSPSDEVYHNLVGWNSNQIDGPIIPPSGDASKRYQAWQTDNSVQLFVPQANAPYTLITEVEDGGCDDSFEIYVNGQGPVYTYYAAPLIEDVGGVHIVSIPGSLITTTAVLITYRNIGGGDCGLAPVFNAKLIAEPKYTLFIPAILKGTDSN